MFRFTARAAQLGHPIIGCFAAVIMLGPGAASVAQVMPGDSAVTSMASAEGLTLKIIAACSLSGRLCPFRAEIHAAPTVARRIQRVVYTYVPDRRTAPSVNTNSSENFRLDGSQYTGELVYADVFLAKSASRAATSVLLQTTVPFSAPVQPALPAGLRFEDKYQMEFLEGTPTDYYQFRIRLRGLPAMIDRILFVEYRLPDVISSRPVVRATRLNDFYVEGGGPRGKGLSIEAVIHWINGRVSSYTLPFRPE